MKALQVPEKLIAVDWSGRKDEAGQKRHIWAGVWHLGRVDLQSGRTREELCDWLIAEARATKSLVVGVDFCFSYPAWFVREHGARSAIEFWGMMRAQHSDHWLSEECKDARFWGRPRKKPPEFCGDAGAERMLRLADRECKLACYISDRQQAEKVKGIAPKSPFQIGGAGAVGTGTLRGIPLLPYLRDNGFSIWPFDSPKLPMLVEIYPRLLTGTVKKSVREERARYLKQHVPRNLLTRSAWGHATEGEDAFDAAVSAVKMGERRREFSALKRATAEIRLLEGQVWGAGSA
jgi:hypothetical protein